ncbi:hypothetical protein PMAYCL1PPCAC_03735, partial [Pristionchus mayeri]
LPGLYAKLLPLEEFLNNRTAHDTQSPSQRSKISPEPIQDRMRRQVVSFRAVHFAPPEWKAKRNAGVKEEEKEKDKETKENEPTVAPIVPLQLKPLEGQPIQPIVPENAQSETKEQSGPDQIGTKESGTKPEPEPTQRKEIEPK